jgi:hypothetical protein
MISGDNNMMTQEDGPPHSNTNNNNDDNDAKQLRAQSEALFARLQSTLKKGDKIVDVSDGKTIGQIVATPEEGTNILLAQLRLDRVGLLTKGGTTWSHTNKVTIGEDTDNQLRYLPYLPLWWPEVDPESGKAKE